MPPRSPLPQRHGVDAAWVRTPDHNPDAPAPWATMGAFLADRLAPHAPVAEMLAGGAFVDAAGRPWTGAEPYRPHTFVWFHRPLAPEPVVPFPVEVLHADERIVVVDKPPFLATTPRGTHVRESVLTRLRTSLGLPGLAPAHRLDRLTAGVLVLTTERRHRAAYAGLFQGRHVTKTYEALAPIDPGLTFPRRVVSRIVKRRESLQAEVVPGEPNAETLIDLVEARGPWGPYRLVPATGKTHQLRLHLSRLGLPIVGDPLYPRVLDVAPDDFSAPLQLVARELEFTDPVDGTDRVYTSRRPLRWPDA
nr:pseudouridylate synthase [Propionibacterium sp.]